MATNRLTSLGSRVEDLEAAWKDRLEDAEPLRATGRYSSAIVCRLYALEILLKVRICRHLGLDKLPRPFEIHELRDLLILSGFSKTLESRKFRHIKRSWEDILSASSERTAL